MRSQLIAARIAFAVLLLAVLVAGAAIGGVRLGQFSYATGLAIMWPAAALGVVALALALWWLKGAIGHNVGSGKRLGLAALIGSLAFLYAPAAAVTSGWRYPVISDAASDPDDPPRFVALAKLRKPGMNGLDFDGQRKISYGGEDVTVAYALHIWKNGLITHPHTKLLPNSRDPQATVFWHCFEMVKAVGWTIVDYSAKDGRIEATAASPWFGQVSDIVIRVRPAGYMGARYEIRAQSRTGDNDHGFNIRLIRAFRAKADT